MASPSSHPSTPSQLAVQWQRRERIQSLLKVMAKLWLIGLAVVAVIVVVVRSAIPAADPWLWPLLLVALGLPLLAVVGVWRQRRPVWWLQARIDQAAGSQGWAFVGDDRAWAQHSAGQLAGLRPPPLNWAVLAKPAVVAALLAGLWWIPQALPTIAQRPFTPPAQLLRLEQQLAALAEEEVLPAEDLQAMEETLAQLKDRDSAFDAAAWQALDRLTQRLAEQSQDQVDRLALGDALARELAAQAQAQAQAQSEAHAADADQTAAWQAQQAAMTASAADLAQALADLSADHRALSERLQQIMANADPQSLSAWNQALEQALQRGQLSARQVAQLQKAGLHADSALNVDPDALASATSQQLMGAEEAAALAQLAESLAQEMAAISAGSAGLVASIPGVGMRPGNGGVNRGPGAAPLTRTEGTSLTLGEAEQLSPALRVNPDGSLTLREVGRDPELDAEALRAAQRAQVQRFDPAAADARRVRVAAPHRAAVEAYFDPDRKPANGPE